MLRRSLALAAVLAAALLPASVLAHSTPHPLSLVHVENIVHAPQASATVQIDAPQLTGTGQTVTVSWTGVASQSPGGLYDWVGVWSPKPDNYSTTAPSKYKWVVPDENGAGSTDMFIVNMRANVVVAYFTGGLLNPVLVAESAPVEFENYHLPLHVHVALTQDPTQIRVDWNSAGNQMASIYYGLTRDNLNMSSMRVLTSTIQREEFCGAPATTVGFHDSGFLHTVILTDLVPNTRYFYQVGDESAGSKSAVLDFYTAPNPVADDVEFVIFGDLGQVETDGSNEASQMDGSILTTVALAKDLEEGVLQRNASAAVFHIGDISYARGFATIWEQFFYQLAPMSPYIPWMTVDGNHERDFPSSGSVWTGQDSGGECGVALAKRFHMPNPPKSSQPGAVDPTWWSLDFGPVHFTVMSTELAFNASSAQMEWLQADFAAVDRKKTPFLILAGHRPMYIDSTNDGASGSDQTTSRALIDALEPLMVKYQVDVAFWGHHHSYQRTCAVHNHTCVSVEQGGVVHIVTGAAGAGFSTNLISPQPDWINFITDKTHGYVRAQVRDQRRTLQLQFVDATTRKVLDRVHIMNKFAQQHKEEQQQPNTQRNARKPKILNE